MRKPYQGNPYQPVLAHFGAAPVVGGYNSRSGAPLVSRGDERTSHSAGPTGSAPGRRAALNEKVKDGNRKPLR